MCENGLSNTGFSNKIIREPRDKTTHRSNGFQELLLMTLRGIHIIPISSTHCKQFITLPSVMEGKTI